MPNTHETLAGLFGDIADAIRAKTGGSAALVADAFPSAIAAIPTGGGGALKILVTAPTGATVTAEKDGGTYTGVEDAQDPGSYTVSVPEYGTYTVTAAYQGSSKSKTVTVTADSAAFDFPVPSGYTQLEYIESSGEQYIDTDIASSRGFRIVGSLRFLSRPSANMWVFGAESASSPYNQNFLSAEYSNGNHTLSVGAMGLYSSAFQIAAGTDYEIVFSTIQNHVGLRVNSVDLALTQASSSSGYTSLNAYLFCMNFGGTPFRFAPLRLSELIADFYPCKRSSDGAVGLYDAVRGRFFSNAGSGSFTAGPEV